MDTAALSTPRRMAADFGIFKRNDWVFKDYGERVYLGRRENVPLNFKSQKG